MVLPRLLENTLMPPNFPVPAIPIKHRWQWDYDNRFEIGHHYYRLVLKRITGFGHYRKIKRFKSEITRRLPIGKYMNRLGHQGKYY